MRAFPALPPVRTAAVTGGSSGGYTFTGDVVINEHWTTNPVGAANVLTISRQVSGAATITDNTPLMKMEHIANSQFPYAGFVINHNTTVPGGNPGGSYLSLGGPTHNYILQYDYLAGAGTPNYQGDVRYMLAGAQSKHIFQVNTGSTPTEVGRFDANGLAVGNRFVLAPSSPPVARGIAHIYSTASAISSSALVVENTAAATGGWIQAINDAGSFLHFTQNGSAAGNGFLSAINDGGRVQSTGAGGLALLASNAAGAIRFGTGSAGLANERMRINSSGRVLVGPVSTMTDDGSSTLQVGGTAVFNVSGTEVGRFDANGLMVGNVQIGGVTSAFPSLRRSGAVLDVKLADNSAHTSVQLLNLIFASNSSVVDWGDVRLARNSATLFDVRANGGMRVRNFNNTVDAPMSAASGTFSGAISLSGHASNPKLNLDGLTGDLVLGTYSTNTLRVNAVSASVNSPVDGNIAFRVLASTTTSRGLVASSLAGQTTPPFEVVNPANVTVASIDSSGTINQGLNARWTIPATGQRDSQVGNGSGTWQTGYREQYDVGGLRCGFFGSTPVAQQSIAAVATDPATTQTLANSLRTAMLNLGLGV